MRKIAVGRRALAVVVSMCLWDMQAWAEAGLQVHWSELAPVVAGKTVWLPLDGGVRIEGRVQGVDSTGLTIEVTRTSSRESYPKGVRSIPRSAVSVIQLTRLGGHKGLIIGGAAGTGIGATAGVLLNRIRENEGGTAGNGIIAAAVLGSIGMGLLLGWIGDRAAHGGGKRIVVIPD